MGRRKTFDEEEVVAIAAKAFWRRGYGATSTRDIEVETGLSTASLYHTFKDKRTLFRRGLEVYMDAEVRSRFRAVAPLAPLARIKTFVRNLIVELSDPEGGANCLVVNSVLEIRAEETELRSCLASYLGEVEAFLRGALEEAAGRGELAHDQPIEELARGLMAMVMGLHVLAQIRPGRPAMESAAAPMLAILAEGGSRISAAEGKPGEI